jgi:phospholipid/cholesterol/gamma-HCH transport system substrate-binding protein
VHHTIPLRIRIVLGMAALVLTAGLVSVGLDAAFGAYADTYELHAVFPRSGQGLDTTSTVKLRGVTVGEVTSIRLLDDGRAEVTLAIQDGVHVPDTVGASAEPLSVFGPKFIRLDPGGHELTGPYLGDGDEITRTTAPTEIIDILGEAASLLDAVDPDDLRTIVGNLADGVEGMGPRIGATIDATADVTALLDRKRAEIAALLRDVATLAGTLGSRGDEIRAIADDIAPTLEQLAGSSDELGRILDATSRASFDLSQILGAHTDDIGRLLDGLSPTVQVLVDQLACVPGFLESNADLMALLGSQLLTYELPDGHVAGVVSGPADLFSLLAPLPTVVEPPVGRCVG